MIENTNSMVRTIGHVNILRSLMYSNKQGMIELTNAFTRSGAEFRHEVSVLIEDLNSMVVLEIHFYGVRNGAHLGKVEQQKSDYVPNEQAISKKAHSEHTSTLA